MENQETTEQGAVQPTNQEALINSALDADDPFLNDYAFEGNENEVDPAAAPNPKTGESKDKQVAKPEAKPDPTKTPDPKGDGEGETKDKKVDPLVPPQKGFPAFFFKEVDAEDGTKKREYDIERAMKYQSLNSKRYEPLKQNFAEAPEETPDSDKSQAEIRIEKKAEYVKNTRSSMSLYGDCMNEAISKGYSVEEAMKWAQKNVDSALNEDLQKYEMDMELEREKEYEKRFEDKFGNKEVESKVASNQNTIINQIASTFDLSPSEATDKYVELLTHGRDIMNYLFKLSHLDLDTSKITTDQFHGKVDKWFKNHIASDINMLRFAVNTIMDSVNSTLTPYQLQQISRANSSQGASSKRGNMRAPSNINKQNMQVDEATQQEFAGLSKMTGMPVERLLEI